MKLSVKILRVVSYVLVFSLLLLAIMLVGARLFGLEIYTVLSPSMEPEYLTGSIIYVRNVDPEDLEVDDVITFHLTEDITATHRIIEILPAESGEELRFRTKGDNNDEPDVAPVYAHEVVGQPVFNIPLLGYVAAFIQQPPGLYVAIAGGLIILLLVVVTDVLTDDKPKGSNPAMTG